MATGGHFGIFMTPGVSPHFWERHQRTRPFLQGCSQTFQNEGGQRGLRGEQGCWLGLKMAALNRLLYKVSFCWGSRRRGWISDWGAQTPPATPLLFFINTYYQNPSSKLPRLSGHRRPKFDQTDSNIWLLPNQQEYQFSLLQISDIIIIMYENLLLQLNALSLSSLQ